VPFAAIEMAGSLSPSATVKGVLVNGTTASEVPGMTSTAVIVRTRKSLSIKPPGQKVELKFRMAFRLHCFDVEGKWMTFDSRCLGAEKDRYHCLEHRPAAYKRVVDLISDALPFARL
jgi:hypothetical protein